MNSSEFWNTYNQLCKKNESPSCSFKDHPLSGDHGSFEVAVFQNEEGKWCIESTIERSNDSRHNEFDSEEECFRRLLKVQKWDLENMGFPKRLLEMNLK